MNFKLEYGRLSTKECPLMAGQYALRIIEDESGKSFSELISEYLSPKGKELSEIDETNKVLGMKYIIYTEIHSSPTTEDILDVESGLKLLDGKSFEYRDGLAKTDKEKIIEARRRTFATLNIKGCFLCGSMMDMFDSINCDISDVPTKELEDNVVNIVEITQRLSPKTFVVSKEIADELNSKETTLYKTLFKQCDHTKNVFAENTENSLVRSL